MSDWQSILLILWALYLFETVLWLPDGAVVFSQSAFGEWKIRRQGWRLEGLKLQGFLAPFFPPLSRVLVCQEPQLGMGTHGFWCAPYGYADSPLLSARSHFPFDDISKIDSQGSKLMCDGTEVARLSSAAAARRLVALLLRLKQSSALERQRLLEAEHHRVLDGRRLQETLSAFHATGRRLRWACHLEFALLFVVFPLLVQRFGFRTIWLPLLVSLVSIGIYISREFHLAHRTLYGADDPGRGAATATVLLSPVAAVRAVDELQKHAAGEFDPLSVSATLCDPKTFEAEASRILRQLLFPLPSFGNGIPREFASDEAWFRSSRRKALEALISQTIADPSKLLAAPTKESSECRSYCPRCCAQYVFAEGECAECALPVVSFDALSTREGLQAKTGHPGTESAGAC